MIQFLADSIDQLDLALDQLAVRDRNFDRFALMLVDNVAELLLHQFAQEKFSENGLWGRFPNSEYDPKIVQQALGPKFDSKLNCAVKLGLIDEGQRATLQNLHSYRNKAYHQGMRHDGILNSMAIFYLRNACSMAAKFTPGTWWSTSKDQISLRAMKYVGTASLGQEWTVFPAAFARIDAIAATLPQDLVADLANDMLRVIDTTDEQIQYLTDNLDRHVTRDQVVIDVQTWPFGFSDKALRFAKDRGVETATPEKFLQWIKENYVPEVVTDPIPSWRGRHKALAEDKNAHTALNKYCQFMRSTEELRGYLIEASIQLESHVQRQIDAYREERSGFL